MKYRKKPVEIEAWQWKGNLKFVPEWVIGAVCLPSCNLEIRTLEGIMIARLGDWIIKGVAGEIYPVKPHIFEETYEQSEPSIADPSLV